MAFAGKRDDALRVLSEYLDTYPDDTDARTLFGTVLSWQGEYDEARVQLQTVLDGNPTHGDALPALVNVELWSDHPERAASMAAVGLAENPTSSALLVTRVRALWNLSREREALDVLNEALAHDPANETALRLRRTLRDTQRFWRADVAYAYDSFSDGRAAWRETRYSITRQTRIGSVIGRFYHAKRFGLSDRQVEVEMYPRFREGTYAYVSGAFAPNPVLFPGYRVGVDLYQSLGAGFEVSAGFRRLQFDDTVNIYVGSLTKYKGNWMLTGRVFATPRALGTSISAPRHRQALLVERPRLHRRAIRSWGVSRRGAEHRRPAAAQFRHGCRRVRAAHRDAGAVGINQREPRRPCGAVRSLADFHEQRSRDSILGCGQPSSGSCRRSQCSLSSTGASRLIPERPI